MHGRPFGHSAVPKYFKYTLFLGFYVRYILYYLHDADTSNLHLHSKTLSDANLHFLNSIAGCQTQTCGYFWNDFVPNAFILIFFTTESKSLLSLLFIRRVEGFGKGQYISKAFFLKFHCPKNERNIGQNSALESKSGPIKKKKGHYYVKLLLITN